MSITIAQHADLARRLGVTDAELAEIAWLFGNATSREKDARGALHTATAYLIGYLRGTLLVAGREHVGCTVADCRACANLRRGLAAIAEFDAVYAAGALPTVPTAEPAREPAAPDLTNLRTFDAWRSQFERHLTVAGPDGWVDLRAIRITDTAPWQVTGVHYRMSDGGEVDTLGRRYQHDIAARWAEAGSTDKAAYALLTEVYAYIYGGAR